MPTYKLKLDSERKNPNTDVWVTPANGGRAVKVTPGNEAESKRFLADPDMEWISDTPLWNPLIDETVIDAPGTHPLNAATKRIVFSDIIGNVKIFFHVGTNGAGLPLTGMGTVEVPVDDAYKFIVFTTESTFSLNLVELRDEDAVTIS